MLVSSHVVVVDIDVRGYEFLPSHYIVNSSHVDGVMLIETLVLLDAETVVSFAGK